MTEIKFPHPDPMEEIDQLRRELDVAMVEGQKLQDFSRAMKIKNMIEEKKEALTAFLHKVDPWQYSFRNDFSKENGFLYVGKFNDFGTTNAIDFDNNHYLVARDGKKVLSTTDRISSFSNGFFHVNSSNPQRDYFVNEIGEVVLDLLDSQKGKEVGDFHYGLLALPASLSYIRKDGTKLEITSQYNDIITEIADFSSGLAAVRFGERPFCNVGFVDLDGKLVFRDFHYNTGNFVGEYCDVTIRMISNVIIDKTGSFMNEDTYTSIAIAENGKALVSDLTKTYLLDIKNQDKKFVMKNTNWAKFYQVYDRFLHEPDSTRSEDYLIDLDGHLLYKSLNKIYQFGDGVFRIENAPLGNQFITIDGKAIFS